MSALASTLCLILLLSCSSLGLQPVGDNVTADEVLISTYPASNVSNDTVADGTNQTDLTSEGIVLNNTTYHLYELDGQETSSNETSITDSSTTIELLEETTEIDSNLTAKNQSTGYMVVYDQIPELVNSTSNYVSLGWTRTKLKILHFLDYVNGSLFLSIFIPVLFGISVGLACIASIFFSNHCIRCCCQCLVGCVTCTPCCKGLRKSGKLSNRSDGFKRTEENHYLLVNARDDSEEEV